MRMRFLVNIDDSPLATHKQNSAAGTRLKDHEPHISRMLGEQDMRH
jgi:hypothetical protein